MMSWTCCLKKNDKAVIAKVEHILIAAGLQFDMDFQMMKENLLLTDSSFIEQTLKDYRNDISVFTDRLSNCIFNFDDIAKLDDMSIQKLLRDIEQRTLAQALNGVIRNNLRKILPQYVTEGSKHDKRRDGAYKHT